MMSTTLNKLEYLDETKGQIKTALNQFGAGITDETTFRDYTNKIEGIYNNWPKVTGSGTEITLNNTKAAKMVMDVKGNSMQGDNPSPESPQTIYSAGDNGSITEIVAGKNRFNINGTFTKSNCNYSVSGNSLTLVGTYTYGHVVQGISNLKGNEQYRLHFEGDNAPWIRIQDSSGTLIGETYNAKGITFTTPTNGTIMVRLYATTTASSATKTFTNIQLEEGTATSYTPYIAEQNITMPCQQPMRSIGTVRDEFVKVNDVWYERHWISKKILDGSENWEVRWSDTNNHAWNTSIINLKQTSNDTDASYVLSNYYKSYSSYDLYRVNGYGISNRLQQSQIIIKNNEFTSTNAFKAWLAANNTEIIYATITPTDLPCTSEQIEVLEGLQQVVSYDTQTNINTTDTTPAYVEASALEKGGN